MSKDKQNGSSKERTKAKALTIGPPRQIVVTRVGKLPVKITSPDGDRIVELDDPRLAFVDHYNSMSRSMPKPSHAALVTDEADLANDSKSIEAAGQAARRRLERLSNFQLRVTYNATSRFESDPEGSLGRIVGAYPDLEEFDPEMTVDLRKGNIEGQLVDELHRLASYFTDLATAIALRVVREGKGGAA